MSDPTQPTPGAPQPPSTTQQPAAPAPASAPPPPGYAPPPPGYAPPPPGYAPPGYPPGAFPAPAAQTWGQAPPPQANKRKPGLIIGAAVAAVGLVGGTFAVINLTKDKDKPAVPTSASDVGVTIDPNDGPAPAPPDTPATIPGPTTPPSVVTTTLPPPSTTNTTPPSTIPPSGDVQQVFDRVSVAVPSGWEVGSAESGFVALATDGAAYYVTAGQVDTDAHTLTSAYFEQAVTSQLENVQIQGEGDADLPTSSVVSGYILSYQGVLATQQGSLPVEGIIITYVAQDGVAAITETFNPVGDFDSFIDAYDAMLNSILSTL